MLNTKFDHFLTSKPKKIDLVSVVFCTSFCYFLYLKTKTEGDNFKIKKKCSKLDCTIFTRLTYYINIQRLQYFWCYTNARYIMYRIFFCYANRGMYYKSISKIPHNRFCDNPLFFFQQLRHFEKSSVMARVKSLRRVNNLASPNNRNSIILKFVDCYSIKLAKFL